MSDHLSSNPQCTHGMMAAIERASKVCVLCQDAEIERLRAALIGIRDTCSDDIDFVISQAQRALGQQPVETSAPRK